MAVTRIKLFAFIRAGPLAEMLAGLSVCRLDATERCRLPALSGCPDWSSPQSDRLAKAGRSVFDCLRLLCLRMQASAHVALGLPSQSPANLNLCTVPGD